LSDGSVKAAVLLARGVEDKAAAQVALDRSGQSLRRALETVEQHNLKARYGA